MRFATPMLNPDATRPVRRGFSLSAAVADWPARFVLFAIACAAGLLVLAGTPLRLPLRVAVYGASLALLVARRPRYRAHPALKLAVWVPVLLAASVLNPQRSTLLAAVAQGMLYLSILAPLAWVAAGRPDHRVFRRVALILWAFYVASAAVGVLQVYNPGRFQGAVSEVTASKYNYQHGAAAVVLADGTVTQKPMGLTDSPGGAASGGLNAIVLGTGLLLTERSRWLRYAAVAGMAVGLFCIFLSQIRSLLVMGGICSVVTLVVLGWRADWGRAAKLGAVLAVVAAGGTFWAFAVAGEQTIDRFSTLVAEDPGTVFQKNRGHFLQAMLTEDIYEYPFGAGTGRWGMMNYYFGRRGNAIWSEMIWTSWLYDGGIPLVLLNAALLAVMLWTAWKIATRGRRGAGEVGTWVAVWAAVVLSYDVAAVAASFVTPIFSVQGGLEVWLINALLFSASRDPAALGPSRRSVEVAARPGMERPARVARRPQEELPRRGWQSRASGPISGER